MRSGSFFAAALAFLALGTAWAAMPVQAPIAYPNASLALNARYAVSNEPLTTEKAWGIDPDEPNPHRQRWLLGRKVELKDLLPRELHEKGALVFGVRAAGIDASTTAYFRPDGPWYRAMREFPCGSTPASWFATAEGSRLAAERAAKEWEKLLEAHRVPLASSLKHLTAATPGAALEKGRLVFEGWLARLDAEWRAEGRAAARRLEWKTYLETARDQGICAARGKGGKGTKLAKPAGGAVKRGGAAGGVYEDEYVPAAHRPVAWEQMMEPPGTGDKGRAGAGSDEARLLARAPAKTWDGMFSVRLSLTVGAHKLNGSFLIDSGSPTSVVSPDFLSSQGIVPAWIGVPTAPVRRVPWGGSGGKGGLAPVVELDAVEIGDLSLPFKRFALFDSEFFSLPDSPKSCCDGVLGADFLRRYVVELHPGPPAEVKLWPAENFHLAPEGAAAPGAVLDEGKAPPTRVLAQWFESEITPEGQIVSDCRAERPGEPPRLDGLRWDTGRPSALYVHAPWQAAVKAGQKAAKSGHPSGWDIHCGPTADVPIATHVPATFVTPGSSPEGASLMTKSPAFSVGMELLSRGRVFFDLPHGRVWMPDKTSEEPILRDHSGLSLKYDFVKGKGDDRALFVKSIAPKGPAQALYKRGLRPGMTIVQIDKKDTDDMDIWMVRRHLAGVFGEQVLVQWKSPRGLVLGAMKVR
jgi:hypothetical protein